MERENRDAAQRPRGTWRAPLTTSFGGGVQAGQELEQLLALGVFATVKRRQRAVHVFLGKPVRQLFEHVFGIYPASQRTTGAVELVLANLVGRLLVFDDGRDIGPCLQ